MILFTGIHRPYQASSVAAACISVQALARHRSAFRCAQWLLGSGAAATIKHHGDYPEPPSAYAAEIRRWATNGGLLAAVAQDYPCHLAMLRITGKSIATHQALTIQRYDALLTCDIGGVWVMPVLQGYAPADYAAHVREYGKRLRRRAWVAIGSTSRVNCHPAGLEGVVRAIRQERPDLKLHALEIKPAALEVGQVSSLLWSADLRPPGQSPRLKRP
jgi:hypothetical protein